MGVALTAARSLAFPVSLIAALACALPSWGHAQRGAPVSGTVIERDGHPLSGVVVAVQGLGISVATSPTGRYVLPGVPAGQHVLQFYRIGYAQYQVTVDVTAGTSATADAVLDPQPVELGNVVIEGVSRAPDRMIDAAAAVQVVQPAVGEPLSIIGQVPLALARVPGLDIAQASLTDFNINARGFNTTFSRKVLVLQDGRDLATGLVGEQIWGALSQPLEDLGRIEVIRGPASALYGPNAFNGVISITTLPARDVVGTKLTLGGGELGTGRADLRHAGVWFHDRLGYRVNVGYTRSDDWTRSRTSKDSADWKREYAPATPTPPPSTKPDSLPLIGQTKGSVSGQAVGTPDPLVTVYGSARLEYYTANRSVLTLEGGTARADNSVAIGGSGRNQRPRALRPWVRLAWDADGSGVSAWYSGLSLPIVRLISGERSFDNESVWQLEGRTSRMFHGDAGRVVVGASVQDNHVNTGGTFLRPANDDRSDQYYGAFAQLEYGVRHLRVIGAMRWDDSNLFPTQLSPKGAVVFTPVKNHALHLTVDRAFLALLPPALFKADPAGHGKEDLTAIENQLRGDPSVGPALTTVPTGTLFTNSAAVPDSSFGNPHLVPQMVTSYEVGYKGQIGRRVFITVDAYDAHIENFATSPLPVGTTGVNPDFKPWSAPPEVPAGSRADVEAAVLSALAARGPAVQNGLTRLADGTTAIVLSYGNAGTVDEWGLELGSSVSLTSGLTFSGAYTWYNFAIRQNIAGNVLAPNTPRNKGTLALDYVGRQVTLGVDARIVAGYPWSSGIWVGYIPPSQTVNLDAGYRINPHIRAQAIATNLLDQRRFQVYGGAVIGRRVLVAATSTF